jgi:ketosteroid isomerase-like protein
MKTNRFFILLFILALATPIMAQVGAEQIKKNAQAAYDALNRRDYATFKTLVSPDFVEYAAGPVAIKGIDRCIEAYKQYFAMSPDAKFEITKTILEGDHLVVETTATGTNTGVVMGMLPATGKKFKVMDVDILTFDLKTGKALSHSSANPNGLMQQIGYGSIANPSTGVIMAAYAAFGKGDAAGIAALCSENAVWECADNPSKAARSFVGNKNIPAFFADLMSDITVTKFQPTRFVADGDDVMVAIDVEWIKNGQTQTMAAPFNHHFKVQDGKIVWFREVVGKHIMAATMVKK